MADYRERLYESYVEHATGGAADIQAALAARKPYCDALVRRHFPADRSARILDLGCGHGAILYFARQRGYANLAGVDRAPDQVAAARALGLNEVREGDLFDALRATASATVDVVIAFDVLEHLEKQEVLSFLDEVYRVLAPEGRCILHVPNGDAPFVGRVYFGDFTHELAFTRSSISQVLSAAGFTRIECHEDTPVVHGAKSAARHLLWRAIRAGLRFYVTVESGGAPANSIFSQNFLAVAHKR